MIDVLLPNVFTDSAAAKELTINESLLPSLNLRHNATIDNIVSPAPILSTALSEKAGQD